jgi:fumarate hydratase class II
MKIANDIPAGWRQDLASLGELRFQRTNPVFHHVGKGEPHAERTPTMVAVQVMGNDAACPPPRATLNSTSSSPLLSLLFNSVRLLADGCDSFDRHCAAGIEPNRERIEDYVKNSLMLVTALNPHIGYDKAAKIAKKAHKEGTSLKDAALALGFLSSEEFDQWVRAEDMTRP